MNNRCHTLVYTAVLALALSFGSALAAAAEPYYAVAAGLGKVFLIKYDNGTATSSVLSEMSQSSFTGIATWTGHDNQVFVADSTSLGETIPRTVHVGRITNVGGASPSIEWLNEPIPLVDAASQVKQPSSLEVDPATGAVCVVGGRWRDSSNNVHSSYAYITSSNEWADADSSHVTVSIADRSSWTLADVAVTSGGGLVFGLQDAITEWAGQTCAMSAVGVDPSAATFLGDAGYFPQAIAVGSGDRSYIANYSTELDPEYGPTEVGSISCIDSHMSKLGNAFPLGTFRPTDLAFFSIGDTGYLGVVGVRTDGKGQAWKIPLDAGGLPLTASAVKVDIDNSSLHYCTVSQDGSLFWVTNPQSGSVTVFDTDSWTPHNLAGLGASVGHIASFTPDVITVPKPWLASLPTQIFKVGKPFTSPKPQFIEGQTGSTFTAAGLPVGATCDPATGIVTWPSPFKATNNLYTITLTATNEGGSGSTSYVLSLWPKEASDREEVATAKMVVTAAFQDAFCIESQDRMWGMLVMQNNSGLSVGQLVDVRGTIGTDSDGVRKITASKVTVLQGTTYLRPFYLPMRSLGGSSLMFPSVPSLRDFVGQLGVTGGYGLNNVSMLVRISGTVTWISDDGLLITISDGSAETLVQLSTALAALKLDDYVTVTGVCRMYGHDDGTYTRGLRAQDSYALTVVPKQTQP